MRMKSAPIPTTVPADLLCHARDHDLERAVLAGVMDQTVAAFELAAEAGVTGKTFTDPQHAAAWLLACRAVAAGERPTPDAIVAIAGRMSFLDLYDAVKAEGAPAPIAGGDMDPADAANRWISYTALGDIQSAPGMVANAKRNVTHLRALEDQRRAILAAQDALALLTAPAGRENRERALAAILDATAGRSCGGTVQLADAMTQALAEHDAARERGGVDAARWGIASLDAAVPLARGRLIVVAAPPGAGKTSIMLAAALASGRAAPGSVAVCSLEVPPADLARRVLSGAALVPSRCMERGMLTAGQRQAVELATTELSGLAIAIRAPADSTTAAVVAWIRAQHQRSGGTLRLVVLDYLQRLAPADPRQTEIAKLTDATGALARLAVDLGVCLLVGSQFNRDGTRSVRDRSGTTEAPQPEPRLADLRGSGSIEQDANAVIGLWSRQSGETSAGEVIACILKNREGANGGRLPLWWDRARGGIWTDHLQKVDRTAACASAARAFGAEP